MKKYIIAIALALFTLSGFAQSRIIYNKYDHKTGIRTVGTSARVVRNGMSDTHGLDVSLIAMEYQGDRRYMIFMSVCERASHAVPEGAIFLVRTASGNVYQFQNEMKEEKSRDFVGTFNSNTLVTTYHNRARYSVTLEQLKDMAAGVVKIRMELKSEVFDVDYKKDPFGKAIFEHLKVISDADWSQRTDITSDF